jgi:hypothetical protein
MYITVFCKLFRKCYLFCASSFSYEEVRYRLGRSIVNCWNRLSPCGLKITVDDGSSFVKNVYIKNYQILKLNLLKGGIHHLLWRGLRSGGTQRFRQKEEKEEEEKGQEGLQGTNREEVAPVMCSKS